MLVGEKMKVNKVIKLILTILVILFCLGLTCFGLVISDKNMNSKQGLPDFNGTTLDFEGRDIDDSYLKQHMIGEYEFYYNKFIVSDHYEGPYDTIVKVPHHFKGTYINGEEISSSGYASYKCYVKGLPIGTKIWLINNNFVGSFYAYINNELVLKYGSHNKDGLSYSNGGDDLTIEYIVKDNNPLEIVFEVGASFQGGLTSPARLVINTFGRNPTSQYLTNNIGFIMFGIFVGLLIFSLVININVTNRDYSFFVFMLLVTLMCFFSIDVYWRFLSFIKINTYNCIIFINLLLSLGISFSLYYLLSKKEYVKKDNIYYLIFGINSLIDIVLYFVLMGTFYQVIPLMMSLINYLFISIGLVNNDEKGKWIRVLFIIMILSLSTYFTMTFFDLENIMIAGLEQSISYIMLPLIIIIIILYRISTVSTTKKYIKLLETEKESLYIKAESLKRQIKPHYVFNLLTSIEQAYREDYEIGEEMLRRFSKHLRYDLQYDQESLIPFEEEVNYILNYVEIEKLRLKKNINLLLNIEENDVKIPPLSIEVFIENAIKHSHVIDKEDGFISLSLIQDDNYNIIEIEDNGVGSNNIKEGTGIKNAVERIKILLSGKVAITSKVNEGTKITIYVPRKD